MKNVSVFLGAALLAASLLPIGCGQAAPVPTPTRAPVPPTKAAEPTKPAAATAAPTRVPEPTKPVAQPTAAPAKKVDFPQKGKAITVIVPVPAGGSADVGTRLVATALEKELGTPVQVVNKVGAGGQVGMTELALSKPDGYTVGITAIPLAISIYQDPQRKAAFSGKDLLPIATTLSDPNVTSVKDSSPHKTLKELLDSARANPEKLTIGSAGIGSSSHLLNLLLEQASGVKFRKVLFDGGAQSVTALLGGHLDASSNSSSEMRAQFKSGGVRILGIADTGESKFLPGVKTMEAQGYKVLMGSNFIWSAPAGTPKEIVDVLSAGIKKSMADDALLKKVEEMGLLAAYMDAAKTAATWQEMESAMAPLVKLLAQP